MLWPVQKHTGAQQHYEGLAQMSSNNVRVGQPFHYIVACRLLVCTRCERMSDVNTSHVHDNKSVADTGVSNHCRILGAARVDCQVTS